MSTLGLLTGVQGAAERSAVVDYHGAHRYVLGCDFYGSRILPFRQDAEKDIFDKGLRAMPKCWRKRKTLTWLPRDFESGIFTAGAEL